MEILFSHAIREDGGCPARLWAICRTRSTLPRAVRKIRIFQIQIRPVKRTEGKPKQMNCELLRDNPIFYNVKECDRENVTQIVHDILGNRLGVKDPKSMDDSSYRLNFDVGKKSEIHHYS